jgi:hypothetical protein
MLLMHHGTDPGARKGVDPVNALAVIYVNDHLESLRAEARQRRTASLGTRSSLRDRIAATATELRRTLGFGATGPSLPTLRNYPFEG